MENGSHAGFQAIPYHSRPGCERQTPGHEADLPRNPVYAMLPLSTASLFHNEPIHQRQAAMDPIVIPIDGILDLHTFAPKDVRGLMTDYIDACLESGIRDVRIVHGKGSGVMRARVRALLEKDPRVDTFGDAPPDAGGWGATCATLKE